MKTVIAHATLYDDVLQAMKDGENLFIAGSPEQAAEYPEVLEYSGVPALIYLTSGTTGRSKPIIIPHTAMEARIKNVETVFGEYMQKTALLTHPSFYKFFAREHLLYARRLDQITSDMSEATFVVLFGKAGHLEFGEGLKAAKNLKIAMVRGFTLTNEFWHQLQRIIPNTKIVNLYATAEVGDISYTLGEEVKNGLAGKLLPGVEVQIVNDEILVKTPGMAIGYIGPDFPVDSEGWYHTGDNGFFDTAGDLHVSGRRDFK